MEDEENTPYTDRREILSELWLSYKNEEFFKEYIRENDLGLPLAFAKENNIIGVDTVETVNLINESFDNLLKLLDLDDDGWVTVDHMIHASDVWREWEDEAEDAYEIPVVELNGIDEEAQEKNYTLGYEAGASAEQKRVQEVISMHKRWAKEKNRASEFMFWDSAGEVLTPINFEYNEEKYWEDLRNEGF